MTGEPLWHVGRVLLKYDGRKELLEKEQEQDTFSHPAYPLSAEDTERVYESPGPAHTQHCHQHQGVPDEHLHEDVPQGAR